ncbi:MAG: hypothetical protein M3N93_07180, partial [Acidobacteriota bacterium]|nr:hypothetical protein [Acidobacteriota bacterium]
MRADHLESQLHSALGLKPADSPFPWQVDLLKRMFQGEIPDALDIPIRAIRVQREPFEANGRRVEDFAEGTRFAKHRMWHVEIEFSAQVRGPLVI